jgi:hypothetical protein
MNLVPLPMAGRIMAMIQIDLDILSVVKDNVLQQYKDAVESTDPNLSLRTVDSFPISIEGPGFQWKTHNNPIMDEVSRFTRDTMSQAFPLFSDEITGHPKLYDQWVMYNGDNAPSSEVFQNFSINGWVSVLVLTDGVTIDFIDKEGSVNLEHYYPPKGTLLFFEGVTRYRINFNNYPGLVLCSRIDAVDSEAQTTVALKRMDICNTCKYLNKIKLCQICNCFMPIKTKLHGMKCPIDKW